MIIPDEKNLARNAQQIVVEVRYAHGSPPVFDLYWQPVWGAFVERIEINKDARPSVAVISFPDERWDIARQGIQWCDNIRIRTNEFVPAARTILFTGFVTAKLADFSGGSEQGGSFEQNILICQDYRWLLSATSPITGQLIRSRDDYSQYGTLYQTPLNSYITATGRRAIFNEDAKPNADPIPVADEVTGGLVPLFIEPEILCTYNAIPWTARMMVQYILSPVINKAWRYLPTDTAQLPGLDHSDWNCVLNHICIDGLNIMEALQLLCRNLGWAFREEYLNNGTVRFVFFKTAATNTYVRTIANPTILQRLHAPAPNETITAAVLQGRKMLWAMSLERDIASVVNVPLGIGSPQRFEFTAELVPAWNDNALVPDANKDDVYIYDSDLQLLDNPDAKSFYKYYHKSGANFRYDVGRKWALNETGRYSSGYILDRGMPFDFATVLPYYYTHDSAGKRIYAPVLRRLLDCITVDKDSLNSIGIKVEISFDGGSTWQATSASFLSLSDECGIYFNNPNLAEMKDKNAGIISGGDLDGIELNYWSSLCDDRLAVPARIFKLGEWHTRVRVTASVQLDQRIGCQTYLSSFSGSLFEQSQVYDFSDKYNFASRPPGSRFFYSSLPAAEEDSRDRLDAHVLAIRQATQLMSVSGVFTLDRLWLNDGTAFPDFAVGDCIEKITGRQFNPLATIGGKRVFPEIIQIIYLPQQQKQQLITRDLRYSPEVPL